MGVVNLVVLACVLKVTSKKKVIIFLRKKVHIREKILATPMALLSINEVNIHRARLVLGWVTMSRLNSRCGSFMIYLGV